MRIRYTPRARDDLSAILQYLDERSQPGARHVKQAIQRTIELIAQYPQSGRLAGERQVRVLPVGHYPYLVYWQAGAEETWIIHIRHARRQPWLGGQADR